MDKNLQKYLLAVAKNAVAEELGKKLKDVKKPRHKILSEKRGVFVTLEIGGQLKGCIGNIMPVYPLEEAIRRNAVNAAFEDPRFQPVSGEEYSKLKFEISVLTVPKKLKYKDDDDLLKKLEVGVDGVVIRKDYYEATYLPQVWDEVPDKEQFLSSLCMKAGLSPEEWKSGEMEVLTYRVEMLK